MSVPLGARVSGSLAAPGARAEPCALARVSRVGRAMGGRLGIHLAVCPGDEGAAGARARLVSMRVGAWADRLSRFEPGSQLTALNAERGPSASVPPTLAAALAWAREASG